MDEHRFITVGDQPVWVLARREDCWFLYDHEDHADVARLTWNIEREGGVVKIYVPKIPFNVERCRRLAQFPNKKVQLHEFLYFRRDPPYKPGTVVRHVTSSKRDMRFKNLELLKGQSRNYKSPKYASDRVLEQIKQCGYANVPKHTTVKEEPTSWHFIVRIPGLPEWKSSRAARLRPADRVRELETHMIAAYEGLERDFLAENADRDAIQAEFEDAMGSLA